MKFVHFNDFRLGVLTGAGDDQVVDITDLVDAASASPQLRLEALIANWTTLAPKVKAAAEGAGGLKRSFIGDVVDACRQNLFEVIRRGELGGWGLLGGTHGATLRYEDAKTRWDSSARGCQIAL